MQSQLVYVVLAAIVPVCYCSHSSCPLDLRDPCASAATQVHDGDIAISVIPSHPNSPNASESESREKRAATSRTERLWPGAVVYYTMSNSYSSSHRQLIYRAMHHWESHTCIRFRPRTTQHTYVNFFPGSGCCSYIGMINCGEQGISLGERCISMYSAVHEIGHAVGFWHEQSRPDRYQYVKILWNNIQDGLQVNFGRLPPSEVNSLGVGYDFNSIMHYHHNSWSKYRNADTIQSKVPGIQVGAGEGLSPLDIEQANRLYRCDRDNPPPLAVIVPSLPAPPPPTKPFPCGEVFLAPSGSFHSPGYYDNDYRRNQDCAWVLRGPENHRLTLTVTTMMKDSYRNCLRDYIEVTYKGSNMEDLKFPRFCGHLTAEVSISRNFATLYYHTDNSNAGLNNRGFETTFRAHDYDECEAGACDHLCHNTAGSYSCSCRDGWYLDAGGRRCFDMNECALGNGGCAHRCVNSAGSFGCECNTGYVLLSDGKSCGEKIVCHNSNGNCEQLCFNPVTPSGNPTCGCRGGYRLAADGVRCLDIDECTEGSHRCAHSCSNLPGSYSCSCRAGYQLNRNGYSCNNIDECRLGRDYCIHDCRDTDGSYECGCPIGQKLAADNHNCEDVDECEDGSAKCSNGCRNTFGSYRCFCPHGFHLDADDATCIAPLTVSMTIDGTPPPGFTPEGPNEYRAASGSYTFTCTATGGAGSGNYDYVWTSTCRGCVFRTSSTGATSKIFRKALHSRDNGIHTCTATRGGESGSNSINVTVVGAGIFVFTGSGETGAQPNNGLVISRNPVIGQRFRFFCRSNSLTRHVGELIGLDESPVTAGSTFEFPTPRNGGELGVENIVGTHSLLPASEQGVYTCRIPLEGGEMREINIGVYPSGFSTIPSITNPLVFTQGFLSSTLTCISTGSVATNITFIRDGTTVGPLRDGESMEFGGVTYQMAQTVTNRAQSTYQNVLTIVQPLADIIGRSFTCSVENTLGTSFASQSLTAVITAPPTVSITIDGTPPPGFTPGGPNEYRAASGSYTVTCTATGGAGSGNYDYVWTSTCTRCAFRTSSTGATSEIFRTALHSGDNGIHTCTATRGGESGSDSINITVVGAGIFVFTGSGETGAQPNNGLVISRNPVIGQRFRFFCRSNSMTRHVGELIGLDESPVTAGSTFEFPTPRNGGELGVENIVGTHSLLPASEQGVYTCRIPLEGGEMRKINIGVYPSGFSTISSITNPLVFIQGSSSSTLTCTSTGSVATNVTFIRDGTTVGPLRDGESMEFGGVTYQMAQTVTNRAQSTYQNVLTIKQPLADIIGSSFTCSVENTLGTSSASQSLTAEAEVQG